MLLAIVNAQVDDELAYPDSFREPIEAVAYPWDTDSSSGLDAMRMDEFRKKFNYNSNDFPPYPWEDKDFKKSDVVIKRDQPNNFTQTQAIAHTCTSSIERFKAGPADWKSILGSGRKYVDETMPHTKNDTVYWPSHPRRDELSFARFNVVGFAPPQGSSMWGSKGVVPHDIIQGDLGDCYFLSSSASLAEHPDRIKKLFLTPEVSFDLTNLG